MEKRFRLVVWGGLNPNLVSALAPLGVVEVGAEFGAELDSIHFDELVFGSYIIISKMNALTKNINGFRCFNTKTQHKI